jgi:hypothetical protein
MSNSFETWRRLLEARGELAEIKDRELDKIKEKIRADLVVILREGIDQIEKLPSRRRPDLETRRQSEIEWLAAVLTALEPPQ